MLSALIPSRHSYRAVPRARELVDQRSVHFGPLVLEITPLKHQRLQKIGDQPVSRIFAWFYDEVEPSRITAGIGL